MTLTGALPSDLAAAVAPLSALAVPWAVAGGWALDLVLDRVTRAHGDVDVAVFRADQRAIRRALVGWTFDAVVAGERRTWLPSARLDPPTHEVHATPPGGGPALELLLNERDGAEWVYRRDPSVRRGLGRALVATPAGLPVLAPELVLLYKAKAPREADTMDFAAVLPHLGAEPRAWLAAALDRCHPAHPWRPALDAWAS